MDYLEDFCYTLVGRHQWNERHLYDTYLYKNISALISNDRDGGPKFKWSYTSPHLFVWTFLYGIKSFS